MFSIQNRVATMSSSTLLTAGAIGVRFPFVCRASVASMLAHLPFRCASSHLKYRSCLQTQLTAGFIAVT